MSTTRTTARLQTARRPRVKAANHADVPANVLERAFRLMVTAKAMTDIYEANFKFVSKYVHATSRGHEAIQLAVAMQLLPQDYVYPYYRDDSILLGIGMRPYDCMLQLMAKRDDPFSGGRSYYCHPSLRDPDKPKIPHQSSATGMQAIPATGAAMGFWYREQMPELAPPADAVKPVVVCSLGDASVTEGEVSEAFQMAVLKKLPILYLVQDNGWDISANAAETRVATAAEYAKGFPGLEAVSIEGNDFVQCWTTVRDILQKIRTERRPFLLHARVPLLNHHTSGVRKEWYRDDLDEHQQRDPYPILRRTLLERGFSEEQLQRIEQEAIQTVAEDFERSKNAPDPRPEDLYTHDFAPTPIAEERGVREPEGREPKVMVDCALYAIEELMRAHPECLLYGQDVGRRLGGVFREAAMLAEKFGDHRVFNTPIQEAFIIGSTVGMSAVGLRPIVEVQFADYIWPGLNQLFTEVSRSCYLSNGKWPASCIIRVPIGAYGSGGPYHSSSVESVVVNIRGVKIAYPSTGADLKGLLKAAYYDPNPVVIFEHKGLYWSKVRGTEAARTVEPDENYIVPFGKARLALVADPEATRRGETLGVVCYGMGVHWALNAARQYPGRVEVLDLRTLFPLDEEAMYELARRHGKILVLTEEPVHNTFAQSLAARISENCFEHLDAPVRTLGAANVPAVPLNETLEREMIPSIEKVAEAIGRLLAY
ncbi:MAG: thiamine pyrophosphate-dependent enzyme [Saprospiraceae bacterium]|nr:thiamine pyrophosphate-dependent enzyme [Saprospiraceae bacterium]MDW8230396.1 thiamine pyrophosphate-dependent enzyme [Saprospiraceae bacterium]